MPPKTKVEKLNIDEAEDVILAYMKEKNRPYSHNDICLNLHNTVSKPNVLKCLLSLESKGLMFSKTYGKIQIFVIKQEDTPALSSDEVAVYENEIQALKDTVAGLSDRIKEGRAKLTEILSTPTTEELIQQDIKLTEIIQKSTEELNQLKCINTDSQAKATPEQVEEQIKLSARFSKEYKSRTKMAKNAWSLIEENFGKSKELAEQL
ncbi:Tat binding protein 1-interacting, partial [Nadsonia fulvescens var. elongata DSM 6958]